MTTDHYSDEAFPLPPDEPLLRLLEQHLARPDGIGLSEATADLMEQAAPPEPLSRAVRARLAQLPAQAEADLAYDEALRAQRRPATLGGYVTFLRRRANLTAAEAAKRFRLDFQWLANLERNALRPQEIPARTLASLLRRLHGSLERTESLLITTIQAPRMVSAGGRDSLYRRPSGAAGHRTAPPDPEVENPDYKAELKEIERLQEALRSAWR